MPPLPPAVIDLEASSCLTPGTFEWLTDAGTQVAVLDIQVNILADEP